MENTQLAKLSELSNGDATYNGAFQIDKRTKGTGKVTGAVSYVASKMGITVSKDTTIAQLRRTYDKATVNAHLAELAQSKNLRHVHCRQIWALIGQDQNYRLNVKSRVNAKGAFTGFNASARFLQPETAKKMSKDAIIAFLRSEIAKTGRDVQFPA